MKRTAAPTSPPMTQAQLDRLHNLVRTLRKPLRKDGQPITRETPAEIPDPMRPTDEVKAAALAALGAWADIWYDGDRALDRAVDYSTGITAAGSAEGHGKGGHSDPVEAAAVLPARYTSNAGADTTNPDFVAMSPSRPDSFTATAELLRKGVVGGAAVALATAQRAKKILGSAPPLDLRNEARCASADAGCEEYQVKDRYCSRCWQWIYDNDGQTPVPKTVIQARKDKDTLKAAVDGEDQAVAEAS